LKQITENVVSLDTADSQHSKVFPGFQVSIGVSPQQVEDAGKAVLPVW